MACGHGKFITATAGRAFSGRVIAGKGEIGASISKKSMPTGPVRLQVKNSRCRTPKPEAPISQHADTQKTKFDRLIHHFRQQAFKQRQHRQRRMSSDVKFPRWRRQTGSNHVSNVLAVAKLKFMASGFFLFCLPGNCRETIR